MTGGISPTIFSPFKARLNTGNTRATDIISKKPFKMLINSSIKAFSL